VNPDDSTAIVRSYAKVNLTLDVLGKRPDGYHAIESVMQSISLYDTLTLSIGGEPGIRVTCDRPEIPTGETNLATRAAAVLLESRGAAPARDIRSEKRIPPEAGLGGGSSNAAAVLRGLNRLLAEKCPKSKARGSRLAGTETWNFEHGTLNSDLAAFAAKVGSDVPFFIVGGTALVQGRGEEVRPLTDIQTQWLLIVKPPFGVSSAWAYRRLDEMERAEPRSCSKRMLECIENEGCKRASQLVGNDLELPVIECHPEIGKIKEALLGAGASAALMCGSGSAAFGLFAGEDEVHAAADRLPRDSGELFVAKRITRREALDSSMGVWRCESTGE